MVRSPSREEISGVKKGPWSPEEDRKLVEHVQKHGCGSWKRMPKLAGLNRCGKSCRLRWTNYLRPDIKRGKFTEEEEQLIVHIHSLVGNKWSLMATKLPGRTDNEIKNYWNTHLRKKLLRMGIDPVTHRPTMNNLHLLTRLSNFLSAANFGNMTTHLENALKLQTDAAHLVKLQLLQSLIQALEGSSSSTPNMDLMRLFGSSSLGDNLQASDLLQLSRQIEACGGGSFNLQDSTPVTPTLSNLGQYSNNIDLQPAPESNFSMDEGEAAAASDAWRMEEHGVEISDVPSTSSFPASNSTPFVSASPETKNIDLIESSDKIYSNPLAFTSFEAWENLNLDNLITDLAWKEDQIPWPNAPYSSGSAIDQIHIERS